MRGQQFGPRRVRVGWAGPHVLPTFRSLLFGPSVRFARSHLFGRTRGSHRFAKGRCRVRLPFPSPTRGRTRPKLRARFLARSLPRGCLLCLLQSRSPFARLASLGALDAACALVPPAEIDGQTDRSQLCQRSAPFLPRRESPCFLISFALRGRELTLGSQLEQCRTRKSKCSRTFPCVSCAVRGDDCIWLDTEPACDPPFLPLAPTVDGSTDSSVPFGDSLMRGNTATASCSRVWKRISPRSGA